MMNTAQHIDQITKVALAKLTIHGKTGRRVLQPAIGNALSDAGYEIDFEDSLGFLASGLPVWRSKDTGAIEPTATRRKIDIVVYTKGRAVALIETESDLNDLRSTGVSSRSGHYDVFSIARSADGGFFHSYKSLERMAGAAFYAHIAAMNNGDVPTGTDLIKYLECIASNSVSDHNPSELHLLLVSGRCRAMHRGVLLPRLKSLSASLVCAVESGRRC